ncbi:hypothetical protein AH04_107 [Erwinia phage AH04]|uniref:Virion structural protein n=1 Tax=Erwinia phage AH04 TaxID=2869569 RepID=A0AAE7X155_9CAUD|nr:hypothetical protein PQC02_gp207 [Erwinia phage AH04]QZA70773.1 hypothetical protein AH04_107 [Erwinia phage AH04]
MIPQALSLGATLLQVATAFGANKKGVEVAGKVIDGAAATYNVLQTGNLAKSASKTLISPLVAIEDTLIHQDYMSDLMTVVNLRDINDVLSHFAQQGSVNGIKVSDLVDSIQPRRSGFLALQGAEAFGKSESALRAMRLKELSGMEAQAPNGKPLQNVVTINGKQVADLQDYKPLAVGRTVDASVTIDGTQLTFPLTFRQTPVPVTSGDLQKIFEAARPQDGWLARIMMAKTGEITSPELLTGEDEIKREFNIRKNDLSGYYTEVTDRASKNTMAALRTGIVSVNTQANTIIMTSETARNIELELGVRFDGSGINKIRKAVMANTIIVVNDALGLFTFYYAGNNIPEEWTQRQITVSAKKDTSMDLASLAKLFGGR